MRLLGEKHEKATVLEQEQKMLLLLFNRDYIRYILFSFIVTPVAFLLHSWSHLFIFQVIHGSPVMVGLPYFEVRPYHWAFEAINKLISSGLVEGSTLGGFTNLVDPAQPSAMIIFGILFGPMVTHLLGFLGLYLYRKFSWNLAWALALGAELRCLLILTQENAIFLSPVQYIDEVAAAIHLGLPTYSLYWLSIVIGMICLSALFYSLPKEERLTRLIISLLAGISGLELAYFMFSLQKVF